MNKKAGKRLLIFLTTLCITAVPASVSAQESQSETPQPTVSITAVPTETPQNPSTPPKGFQINGNKISFYKKGTMLKDRWLNYNGTKYYFGHDGYAYKGSHKINNKVYVFDTEGRLIQNKQNKMVTVYDKKYYIISRYGHPATGYFIYRNNLYYADSKGRCYQNRSRENGQLYFTSTGAAKRNTNALLKMQAMRTVSSLTNSKMTRAQKLRACWNYIVSWRNFSYGGNDPDLKQKGWYRTTALKMLQSKRGNCYSFACAFAAMAKEIGYKNIKIIVGYDHCWITINGKHYDPQTHWSGWIRNVYGLSQHPAGEDDARIYDFMK